MKTLKYVFYTIHTHNTQEQHAHTPLLQPQRLLQKSIHNTPFFMHALFLLCFTSTTTTPTKIDHNMHNFKHTPVIVCFTTTINTTTSLLVY